METSIDTRELKSFTDSLLNNVYWVKQNFFLLPDKDHLGTCINYVDLQEFRAEFCEELVNTVTDWFYSKSSINRKIDELKTIEGRSDSNAQSALRTRTLRKFRNRDAEGLIVQGQFGELVLFNFLQHFFDAISIVRKMPITTNSEMERFGADAIHYVPFEDGHRFYLGEAKTYSSKYKFTSAFSDALSSIIKTYNNHRNEIALYVEDDFIDDELRHIAHQYKSGTITNAEVHLVSIIIYNETKKVSAPSEKEIKLNIMKNIEERCQSLDKAIFDSIDSNLQLRFNYIVFPVWELDILLSDFQKLIGK